MRSTTACIFATFLAIFFGCDAGSGYQKKAGRWSYVTYTGNGRHVQPLHADDGTFQMLEDNHYAKDSDSVFYCGNRILDADPATFRVLDDTEFSADRNNVYIMGYQITGADPTTFSPLRSSYGRDANRIYCGTVPMEVVNIDSFEVLVDNTARIVTTSKDALVYRYGDAFGNLDVSEEKPAVTVKAWARDSSTYYYGPARVIDADYASFRVIDRFRAQDANGQFRGLKRAAK